ncbi:MAG: S-layer homology domain-containing protein [Syntrophomonas sp.]|nr:S-layer homology domain-containing protein [Syntrophomonas sp.]
MLKKYFVLGLVMLMLTAINMNSAFQASAASNSDLNVKNYLDNYPAYIKHDKALADAFLAGCNNSEAQALVARAIWYMENGYMIYGHTKYWDTGFIDCSNFVSLVFKDLGYTIPTASKKYNKVGEKIEGVYSQKITGSTKYKLVGTEKLRPGDILTFWVKNSGDSGTHIGHVAIYMGKINGQPAVIQTNSDRPTAIGIRTDFRYWYGEHFQEARRVLADDSQNSQKIWQASLPVIPAKYQLTPQKPVIMPEARFMNNNGQVALDIADSNSAFTDIAGHWAEANIKQLSQAECIKGYSDGKFRPDKNISRAEFAAALVNTFKLTPKTGKVFNDTATHWAKDFISTLEGHGIIAGYNETFFGPDDPVTREQIAIITVKAAKLNISSPTQNGGMFSDGNQISDWAKNYILTANQAKLISGYPDKTFRAQAGASRAEAITVIVNAVNLKK